VCDAFICNIISYLHYVTITQKYDCNNIFKAHQIYIFQGYCTILSK